MTIHVKSLLTSSLVAGLIINISALTMVPVVGNEFDLVLASRGLPPLSNAAMFYFCAVSFTLGFALIGLYTIAKAQLGSGIKTMLLTAVTIWFLTYFLSNVSMVVYGFMPIRLTVIGTIWGFMELVVAGLAGYGLYKDA